jgi:hypothetical protein
MFPPWKTSRAKAERQTDGSLRAIPAGSESSASSERTAWSTDSPGHGTGRDRRSYTRHRTKPLSDIAALDLARGNWLAKRIVNWLPKDCFRKGYTLNIPGKPELVKKVMTAIGAAGGLRVNRHMKRGGAMARAAGGSALFPVLEGALPRSRSRSISRADGKRILKVKALHLLEPRELHPVKWYDDIENPKFRRPELYELEPLYGGMNVTKRVTIHESRLLVFPGERLSEEALNGSAVGLG